jgi:hypothetical protein
MAMSLKQKEAYPKKKGKKNPKIKANFGGALQ